jgi:GH3 auxin-responsive promoter
MFKNWLNSFVRWQSVGHYKSLMHQANNPSIAQQAVLKELLFRSQNTLINREFNLKNTQNWTDLSKNVPVQNYEAIRPYIRSMMLGEPNILAQGKVKWFAKSSGTTSDKSKFIPLNYANLFGNHIKGGWITTGATYVADPSLVAFKGKQLIMGGSHTSFDEHPHTRYGDVSAILLQHMPSAMRWAYTPDINVALMANTDEKLKLMAQQVVHEDVHSVSGAPTWMTVLFRMLLEQTGKDHLLDIWPNLRVINHGGMSFAPYRQQFEQMIPTVAKVRYTDIYNASEGFFSFADPNLGNDGHLVLIGQGVYYELLPMSEWDSETPIAIPIEAAEIGKTYAPVISTTAGLWRYITGDTIQITSLAPVRWHIVGRMREHINVFGEELMVSDTDKALDAVCAKTGATIHQYTVGPIFFKGLSGKGGHEWVIEFENAPVDLEQFHNLLDLTLQQVNSDYEAKRYKNLALNRLKLNIAPRGTFNRWLKSRGKYGFQNKVPRLANHRDYVDEILSFS